MTPSLPIATAARSPARRAVRRVCLTAIVLATAAGCQPETDPNGGGSGGVGGAGQAGGSGGRGGRGGSSSGSGGTSAGSGGTSAGSGGTSAGSGGTSAGSGGTSAGSGGAGGTSSTGGAGGTADASSADTSGEAATPGPDAAADVRAADTPPGACGTPAPGTVLELVASGKDPYAYFASKNLMPIDGPDSGYITDTGCSFKFVLHENGAEERVSSGAQRQRNELTVNPSNPAMYKGTQGVTMSYTWRFKLTAMNADPTWCDIFQLKPHGALGVAPYIALQADKGQLMIEHFRAGDVAKVPLSAVMNVWINVRFMVKLSDAGSMTMTLTKDDGSMVMEYASNNIDMWETSTDFVRPKWGLYRNKKPGAGEAAIEYNNMTIVRGPLGPPPPAGCFCAK